jgi:GTP cyclohydrolase I
MTKAERIALEVQGATHIYEILSLLGEDPDREGLANTPTRFIKMLEAMVVPEEISFTTFANEGTDQMILQTDIPFFALCEHHMVPFFGVAHVGYLPKGRIVGLSKLARAVRYCAKGLRTQERITTAIADLLERELDPAGVGVILRARHLCMEMRGVQTHDVFTTTSALRGAFAEEDGVVRSEFFSLIK